MPNQAHLQEVDGHNIGFYHHNFEVEFAVPFVLFLNREHFAINILTKNKCIIYTSLVKLIAKISRNLLVKNLIMGEKKKFR